MKIIVAIALALSAFTVHSSEVRVLIYHQITDNLPPGQTVVGEDRFREHLDVISKHGFTTVTVDDVARHMRGEIKLPEKSIALTFDDGWATDLVAAKELQRRNMRATFYIVTGVIDASSYLTLAQLKEIARNSNFQIGAHTHTHLMEWWPNLDKVSDTIFIGEIIQSKLVLESILGRQITSFSWPFGYVRKSVLQLMSLMGFSSVVNVDSQSKNVGVSHLSIERININGRCTASDIEHILLTGLAPTC